MSKPFSTQFISIMNAKIVVLLLAFMLSACDQPVSEGGEKKYSVVGVEIVNGVPSHESSQQLYLAMDYYGAVQAYLWAMEDQCVCRMGQGSGLIRGPFWQAPIS